MTRAVPTVRIDVFWQRVTVVGFTALIFIFTDLYVGLPADPLIGDRLWAGVLSNQEIVLGDPMVSDKRAKLVELQIAGEVPVAGVTFRP